MYAFCTLEQIKFPEKQATLCAASNAILRLGAKGFGDTSVARNSVIYDIKDDVIFYLKFFAHPPTLTCLRHQVEPILFTLFSFDLGLVSKSKLTTVARQPQKYWQFG